MTITQWPISTGQLCKLLDTPEHNIVNKIRAGKIHVQCVGGRRLWNPPEVARIAKILGKDSVQLRNSLRLPSPVE